MAQTSRTPVPRSSARQSSAQVLPSQGLNRKGSSGSSRSVARRRLFLESLEDRNLMATQVFANVPEAANYTLAYELNIPNVAVWKDSTPIPYAVNNAGALQNSFDRIAYYMELDTGTGLRWVYASMDAFTANPAHIGLPHNVNNPNRFQQFVSNMNVASNVPGIVTGNGITTGNIEFWPSNYNGSNANAVPGASGSTFDFGDGGAGTSAGHGSFQVHNFGAGQTLFGLNDWGGNNTSGPVELGIGNNNGVLATPTGNVSVGGNPDWTHSNSGDRYVIKNLAVLVRQTDPSPVNATSGNDTITLKRVNGHLQYEVAGGLGPVVVSDTDPLVIDGLTGNDTLIVDYSGGNPVPTGGLTFNGGDPTTGSGDKLVTVGGTFTTATVNHVNSSDGSVVLDGSLINFTGLEPVDITGSTITNLVINLPDTEDATDDVTQLSIAAGTLLVDSVNGEHEDTSISLAGVTSITVNGRAGDDTITLLSSMSAFTGAITIDGGDGVDDINLNSALSLTTNALTVTGDTIDVSAVALTTTTGNQSFNGQLTLAGSTLNSGSGSIILGGNLSVVSPGASSIQGNLNLGGATRTLTVNDATSSGATDLTISASVSNGGITKAGSGTLLLSGASTYDGATAVNAGIVIVNNPTALGSTVGATTVASSTQLQVTGGITVTGETVTINGPGPNNQGALNSVTGTNEWAGPMIIGPTSNTRVGASAGTFTISGVISGGVAGAGNGLNVRNGSGTATVVLTGANTYLGDTTVVVGILRIAGGNDRLPVASKLAIGNTASVTPAIFDLNGFSQSVAGLYSLNSTMDLVVTNSGALATLTVGSASGGDNYRGIITGPINLTKVGASSQTLASISPNGSNTYTGLTTVSAGTLTLDKTAGQIAIPGNLLINGGTVQLSQAEQIANAANVTINGGSLNFHNGTTAVNETIASLTMTGGAVNTSNNGVNDITVTGATSVSGGIVTVNSGTAISTNSLSLTNTGSLIAWGNNTTRETQVIVGAGGLTMAGTLLQLNRGTAAGTFGSRLVLNGDVTIQSSTTSARIVDDNATPQVAPGRIDLGGVARTLAVADGTAAPDLILGAVIENGSLVKTGAGQARLTAASTYSGTTAINNGLLEVSTGGSLGSTSNIIVGSAGNTATLLLSSTGTHALGTGNVSLGNGGTGLLQQTAGTVTIAGGIIDSGVSSLLVDNGNMTVANGLSADQLRVGFTSTSGNPFAANLTVTGGTVVAGTAANEMVIGRRQMNSSTGTASMAVFDATSASSVTLVASNLFVGQNANAGQGNATGDNTRGTILLSASGTNSLTANAITIGTSTDGGHGNVVNLGTEAANGNRLVLGNAVNNIQTDALTIGSLKSNGLVRFAGAGGTLNLSGHTGASTVLRVGDNLATNTGITTNSHLNLAGGTFNGNLSTVTLGRHGGGSASATGIITMDAGNVTASSLTLGTPHALTMTASATPTATTGTLNLNGGTFAVAGPIENSTGTRTTSGTANINLAGGTLQFATLSRVASGPFNFTFNSGRIQNVPGQNLTNTNVNVNLNGGGLKSFEIDAGQTGTFQAASVVSGNGSLTKVGDGTLLLAGTNTYLGTTNVNDGTLQLQNGNAILNTAGVVTVGLGATLELLSSETVSSLVGGGDAVGANDGLLALGSNTLTTVSSATIADVTSSAGGGIVAGTAIIDGDDDNNITGPNIYLQAATGIGSADPIETAVGAIQVNNTTSGDVQIANSNGGAALTISDLRTLGFGARNLGGALTITNASPLVVAANTSAVAAVLLTAGDSAATGDDLTVNAGVLVESTGSSVTLNAGDDAFVTGNVTAATTVTVNVDEGNADAGVGGAVTITGVITTPLVGGGAFLTGDVDDDEFNFAPQATTAFDVNGDLPFGTPTGDKLNLDISATTAASLILGGIGAGSWSFTPATLRSVVYTSIEDVNANGQYHLVLDANATSFGNTGIDDYLTLRRSGTDFVLERTSNLNLPNDAVGIVFTGDFATILSFTYLGSDDNDILTISDVGGLVDFAGTVPGVTDNGNLAGTAEFLFDGGAGSDRLVFDLTGASAAQSYAIGTGTAAGLEGEVSSTSGGTTLVSYFQDVELAQRTGVGATPGSLTIIGDANANGFTTAANGALTRTSATGYTPFEFSGNNFSGVTINALGGGDSLDLESLGTGQTNSPAITLDGGDGNDTIRAQSTSGNTGDLDLIGGIGNDVFELYSTANTVDGLAGPVDVDGTDGSAGGNLDRLVIIDSGDGSGDNVLIEAVDAATSEDYVITGLGPVTSNVTFRSIDDLQYTGTAGNDTIDAQFVATTPLHDLNTVILAGFNGADQFLLFTSDQLGGTSPTPTPAPSGLSSITLLGGDGFDTFGATPTGLTDTGAMDVGLVVPDSTRMIRPSLSTAIIIDGGPPSVAMPTGDTIGDVLNLDISDLPDTLPVVVASGTVNIPGAPLAFAPLTWTDIEDLNLVDDGVLTNVQVGDLFGRMTDANDLVQFSRLNGVNQVRMRVNNWSGVYTVPGKTIVYGRGGIDHITQANLFNPAVFYGEDGNDVLTGASNNDWLVGGAGNDRISGAEGTNVLWGDDAPTSAVPEPQDVDGDNDGDDNLSAGLGNDVFYGGGGNDLVNAGGGNDYVHGGWGNDNLAGVAGDDRLYGGEGDDVLSGYLGNDLLSGGAGNDRLYGQTGNDVIIGGDGEDMLVGDTGNDLLITGIVANEHSTWSSQAPTSTFSAATYSDPGDNDTALLNLLLQWGSASNSSLLDSITHDGDDDDVAGYTGADDFCWEAADLLDQPGATTPSDFNAPSMGPDERFGPTY
jgi:fibronectin-binding autotransporter adhesin